MEQDPVFIGILMMSWFYSESCIYRKIWYYGWVTVRHWSDFTKYYLVKSDQHLIWSDQSLKSKGIGVLNNSFWIFDGNTCFKKSPIFCHLNWFWLGFVFRRFNRFEVQCLEGLRFGIFSFDLFQWNTKKLVGILQQTKIFRTQYKYYKSQ